MKSKRSKPKKRHVKPFFFTKDALENPSKYIGEVVPMSREEMLNSDLMRGYFAVMHNPKQFERHVVGKWK